MLSGLDELDEYVYVCPIRSRVTDSLVPSRDLNFGLFPRTDWQYSKTTSIIRMYGRQAQSDRSISEELVR